MAGMFKLDVLQKEANNITKNPPLNPTTSACAAFEKGALIGFLGIMRIYTLHKPVPQSYSASLMLLRYSRKL